MRTGLVSMAPSSTANCRIRSTSDRHCMRVAWPVLLARWACQRRMSADPLDRLLPEPGPYIEPQPALGHRQGGRAAVRIGGPDLPPLLGPPAEGKLAALESLPGAAGDAQSFLGEQVVRLVLAADGLGALGAVVQEPPHLVGHAAVRALTRLRMPTEAIVFAYRGARP